MFVNRLFSKKSNKNSNTSSRTPSIPSATADSPASSKSHFNFTQPSTGLFHHSPNTNIPTYTSAPTRRPAQIPLSNDNPPAYTEPISNTDDDPNANLANFDTVFVIDDSGSMAGQSWRETSQALKAIVPICASRDVDGVDLYFLNHPEKFTNIKRAETVHEIFQTVQPRGGTPTGTCLHRILKAYMKEITAADGEPDKVRPMNIIVITDGVPSDDVGSVIVDAAKKLSKFEAPAWQVGIQFFQVGREPGAAEALKELDDDLASDNNVRDMVDTVSWHAMQGGLTGADILKITQGAINRKLDKGK